MMYSEADLDQLAAPNVDRAWFFELDLPTGVVHLHSGVGRVVVDGIPWLGVTDPVGGRVLSMGMVSEPRFGQAAAVILTLTGVTSEFLSSFWSGRRAVEGRSASIWWASVDVESQQILISRKALFRGGRMTAPGISMTGATGRVATLTVESPFSAKNYPVGGRWNGSDQRRRHPGDKGLDFVGVEVMEHWR